MEADDYPVEVILKEAPFPPTLPTLKSEDPIFSKAETDRTYRRISSKHA